MKLAYEMFLRSGEFLPFGQTDAGLVVWNGLKHQLPEGELPQTLSLEDDLCCMRKFLSLTIFTAASVLPVPRVREQLPQQEDIQVGLAYCFWRLRQFFALRNK